MTPSLVHPRLSSAVATPDSESRTALRYLDDSDLLELETNVIGVDDPGDGKLLVVKAAETVFYPQGGGQPWDHGVMQSARGSTFAVQEVTLSPEGVVLHKGRFDGPPFEAGDAIHCKVDADRRRLNTRIHTAGHLVGMATHHIDGMMHLSERKGYHFIEGPYVEFDGTVEPKEAEGRCKQVQEWVQSLVDEDRPINAELCSAEELKEKAYLVPGNLPSNKPIRVVSVQGFSGVPCGGTHTKSTGGVGRIVVSKMKNKKGTMQIKYRVE